MWESSPEAHRGSITDWANSTHTHTHTHILVLCLPSPPASLLAISLTEHITHTHRYVYTFSLYKSFAFASAAAAAAYYTLHSTVTLSLSLIPLFFHPFLLHTLALRHHILSLFSLLFASSLPLSLSLFKIYWDARKYWGGGEAALNPMFTFKKKIDTIAGHFIFSLLSSSPFLCVCCIVGCFSLLWQRSDKRMTSGGWWWGGYRKDRGAWCVSRHTWWQPWLACWKEAMAADYLLF